MGIPIIFALLGYKVASLGVIVALEVGLLSVFDELVVRYIYSPQIQVDVSSERRTNANGVAVSYFNLSVYNSGLSPAKNVEVFIKDSENRDHVNLLRPFSQKRDNKCTILRLPKGAKRYFNLCEYRHDVSAVSIQSDIIPNAQQFQLKRGDSNTYSLEISSDNCSPKKVGIYIENPSSGEFSTSNIRIL